MKSARFVSPGESFDVPVWASLVGGLQRFHNQSVDAEEGFPRLRAAARVCREAAARVRTNVFVRDLDFLPHDRVDNRRLEVVADGFPLHGGAQLAIDTTLVSPLGEDGSVKRCVDRTDAAVLVEAGRRRERTYPELAGVGGRAKLVVLAAEVAGRRSQESRQFLISLTSANVLSSVLFHEGERGLASPVELLVGVHCGQVLRRVVVGWLGGIGGSTPSVRDVLGEHR